MSFFQIIPPSPSLSESKLIVGYKNEKGIIEDLKSFKKLKKKKKSMILQVVKIYLGLSLVLWAV